MRRKAEEKSTGGMKNKEDNKGWEVYIHRREEIQVAISSSTASKQYVVGSSAP